MIIMLLTIDCFFSPAGITRMSVQCLIPWLGGILPGGKENWTGWQ